MQMSGGEREIFFGPMKRQRNGREKIYCERPCRPLDSKTGCACLSPGEWTQTGDTGTRGKEQAPAATTKSAGAKRRCPAECRQSFAGTVKAARPGRSQQALPLTLTSDIRH
ncbi:hypothetical protein NUITMVR1_60140 (plasmid) [Raoultella ornithinolytica]|nr:hypothetical protein NUITMVR1_60140 [Raoultella ornithinolytica]